MRWLVACEFSQMVTKALRSVGETAFSCDLRQTEGVPAWHIQDDVIGIAYSHPWDGMIAHPDCTHMTLAGARWFTDPRFPNKTADRETAIAFWLKLRAAPIKRKAFENPQPLGYVLDRIGRYDQKVQPWQFGDNETKGVCLWLDGLQPLVPSVTQKPEKLSERTWRMAPGLNRQKERSRFFPGISMAMANQWTGVQEMTVKHTCHWPGCGNVVPPRMWGCSYHWFRLPAAIRAAINKAYVKGQEITKTPSREYVDVARWAQAWIVAHQHGLTYDKLP